MAASTFAATTVIPHDVSGRMWTIRRFPAAWLLPVLVPTALLTIFPIAHALWTSLHQVMLLFPGEDWVGLDNYRTVVTGEYFGVALKNSLLFTLFSAPLPYLRLRDEFFLVAISVLLSL